MSELTVESQISESLDFIDSRKLLKISSEILSPSKVAQTQTQYSSSHNLKSWHLFCQNLKKRQVLLRMTEKEHMISSRRKAKIRYHVKLPNPEYIDLLEPRDAIGSKWWMRFY
jgi:hypothetical protein